MTNKNHPLKLLLAIGALVSGISIACSVNEPGSKSRLTPIQLVLKDIFMENAIDTYTAINGVVLTANGTSMTMSSDVTITSAQVNNLYSLSIITSDSTQTLQEIKFDEDKVCSIDGVDYKQTIGVLNAYTLKLNNISLQQKTKTEFTESDISVKDGRLIIFGTHIANKI